jgi:hypothetical protein
MPRFTIIESPYAGDVEANVEYARRACLDSYGRGEVPFASHLLYPQFLDDADASERRGGIDCGYYIGRALHEGDFGLVLVCFYVDRGWSSGMEAALAYYTEYGLHCEMRRIV